MSKLMDLAIFLRAFTQSAISSSLDESTYSEVFEDVLYYDFTNFKFFPNFDISISFKFKLLSLVP